jgi:hypothetical protein
LDQKIAFPSNHFSRTTMEVLAKGGTVMLPYPPPASGRLFIGINPDFNADLPGGSPKFFLRLVQTVSPKQVITRIVDLNELRGISLPVPPNTECTTSREFRTVNEIATEIKEAKGTLTAAETAKRGVYEVCLFADAVIFVRELAPTFVKIEYEFGVSAAEAAENVDFRVVGGSCKCGGDDLPPVVIQSRSGVADR